MSNAAVIGRIKGLLRTTSTKNETNVTSLELASVMDMASQLSLIPIETSVKNKSMLVLGVKGNLFNISFSNIKKIYSVYLSGNIEKEYMVEVG